MIAEKKFWKARISDILLRYYSKNPAQIAGIMLPDRRKEHKSTTLAVHRCRFVDYAPSAITALAFPPLPLPSVKRKRRKTSGKQPLRYGTLAVGHANGNVDLCEWAGSEQGVQCSQAWVVRKVSGNV